MTVSEYSQSSRNATEIGFATKRSHITRKIGAHDLSIGNQRLRPGLWSLIIGDCGLEYQEQHCAK